VNFDRCNLNLCLLNFKSSECSLLTTCLLSNSKLWNRSVQDSVVVLKKNSYTRSDIATNNQNVGCKITVWQKYIVLHVLIEKKTKNFVVACSFIFQAPRSADSEVTFLGLRVKLPSITICLTTQKQWHHIRRPRTQTSELAGLFSTLSLLMLNVKQGNYEYQLFKSHGLT